MTEKNDLNYFRSKGLMPFQAEAVIKFLESKDKPYWELVSPPGTGKTHLAAVIAGEIVKEGNKRILVLAPAATLLAYWHSKISSIAPDCTTMIVDRKEYLEMESGVSAGESPWPNNAIIVMSLDLAKREDMTEKLASVTWDLAIFEESHLLTGRRKRLFKQLTSSGAIRRCLLLTSIESSVLSGVERMVIGTEELIDWNQKPLFSPIKKTVTEIAYRRTGEELDFLSRVNDFANELSNQWSYGQLQSNVVLRAVSSSIYSTEIMLRRLHDKWRPIRNKIVHDLPLVSEDIEKIEKQFSTFIDELEAKEESTYSTDIQPQDFLTLYRKLEELLSQVEEISTDSKFDSMFTHLRQYLDSKTEGKPYLCIFSYLTNTVRYLNSGLRAQDIEVDIYTLTASLGQNSQEEAIRTFREQGGVLIATDPVLKGISLEYVDECINYDLPTNPDLFKVRWARFMRTGQQTGFKMDVLVDRSKVFPWEDYILKIVEKYED